MTRLREHIDGLNRFEAEAAVRKNAKVARKRRRIAGNIDHALY